MAFSLHFVFYLILYISALVAYKRVQYSKNSNEQNCVGTGQKGSKSTYAIVIVTIRYDTRCYFNVRSKADMSRLNLPHGDDN